MEFSDNLQKFMAYANINTVALSKAIGVSDETISNWKKGKSVPKLDDAVNLAKYFGVSLNDLVSTHVTNPVGEEALFIRIPVLGDVSAGSFFMSTLLSGQYLTINNRLLDGYPREECFALHVSGESMQPEFLDRSFIIVHQQRQCRDGDFVIVLDEVTGDNTFKQYREYPDHIDLVPLNKDFQIISFRKQQINRLIIQGVVINKYEPSGKVKLTY